MSRRDLYPDHPLNKHRIEDNGLIGTIIVISIAAFLAWIPYIAPVLEQFSTWFVREVSAPLAKALLVTALLALGTFLYAFRCRRRKTYGFVEILVGVFGAFHVARELFGGASGGNTNIYLAICASLYVIVRGYDNIYAALNERKHWNRIFYGSTEVSKLS